MRYFIVHRVSGENEGELRKTMQHVADSLKEAGHTYYCTFLDRKENPGKFDKMNQGALLVHSYKKLDSCDALIVVLYREEKSEGLLMEIGYSFAKKKRIVLAIDKKIKNTYLREVADEVIEFNNFEELNNTLREKK